MQPRFGLLTYSANPEYNVGDYIQSLAAAQYLPRIDEYLCREKLSHYKGAPVKLIMNGWFMHQPQHWPPSGNIEPLLVSFHLNSQVKDILLKGEGLEWFTSHAPVGCRDLYTLRAMEEHGVPAWLSGCLTTTLENRWNYRTNDIYFVDVLFRVPDWQYMGKTGRSIVRSFMNGDWSKGSSRKKILRSLFNDELLSSAKTLTHYHTSRHTEAERFGMAESFLEKYATAKLVVTSRLHCALPCLAFGTPVIFVEAGFDLEQEWCRLNGITSFFNTLTVKQGGEIVTNFDWKDSRICSDVNLQNPETFRSLVPALVNACNAFVKDVTLTA